MAKFIFKFEDDNLETKAVVQEVKGLAEDEIEDEDNVWINDPDVQDFLESADEPGPWLEEDDKIHTVGGLTNDKEGRFMEFQQRQAEYDAYVDRHEPDTKSKTS